MVKDIKFWRNLLNQENKNGNIKFVSIPQVFQFLMKKYCEKFYPKYDPDKYYKFWKKRKGIISSWELSKEEIENKIESLAVSLDFNIT